MEQGILVPKIFNDVDWLGNNKKICKYSLMEPEKSRLVYLVNLWQ